MLHHSRKELAEVQVVVATLQSATGTGCQEICCQMLSNVPYRSIQYFPAERIVVGDELWFGDILWHGDRWRSAWSAWLSWQTIGHQAQTVHGRSWTACLSTSGDVFFCKQTSSQAISNMDLAMQFPAAALPRSFGDQVFFLHSCCNRQSQIQIVAKAASGQKHPEGLHVFPVGVHSFPMFSSAVSYWRSNTATCISRLLASLFSKFSTLNNI